jgi:putative ABC transport system permease protein
MDILPILRSLRHNRIGALLIALQIALTLAIVANSIFLIQSYLRLIHTPSGLDEANIFSMTNEWAGDVDKDNVEPRITADLVALRSVPGVIDAEATGGFPLCNCRSGMDYLEFRNEKTDKYHITTIGTYLVDQHGLSTYGLKLVAGRWFTATEVGAAHWDKPDAPAAAVLTRQLANELFPNGQALGQLVYVTEGKPTPVVGIVEASTSIYLDGYHQGDAAFVPVRYLMNPINYVVRTRPGAQLEAIQAAQDALYRLTRNRVLKNVRTFAEIRRHVALDRRTNAVMLGVICAVLLAVTVFGIVGLTQFWVTQRRRHIGMRRALGARRIDILKYFHTENLLIACGGCAAGMVLGLVGNTWLVTRVFGLERMSPTFIGLATILLLALSQAAVLRPALRAARVPPAIATRGL